MAVLAACSGIASGDPARLEDSGSWKPGKLRRGADGRPVLDADAKPDTYIVCQDQSEVSGCDFTRIALAAASLRDGDILLIHPGIYREAAVIDADRVTIRALPGAGMRGVAARGKAALVIRGDAATIEGLECSEIRVPSRNGACIRLEGRDLTLRRVHFHDSEEGLLGGRGVIRVEDSLFERLGAGGQAHGIYASGDELIIRRSRFLASKDEGHEIKTRTARTLIEDSVIASLDGDDSRLIDVSNGGEVIIRRNVLEMGPQSVNYEMVGVGYEGLHYSRNSVLIEGNTILVDRPSKRIFGGPVEMTIRGNRIVGGYPIEGNTHYPDRAAAGLPAYPFLPDQVLDSGP